MDLAASTPPPSPTTATHSSPSMQNLVVALKAITSSDGFKEIAGVFDSSTNLKQQLEDRDAELEELRAEMQQLQINHDIIYQGSLENYRKSYEKLEKDKSDLLADSCALKAAMEKKEQFADECQADRDAWGKEVDELKAALEGEKQKVAAAQDEVTQLKSSLEEKDAEIEKLKEHFNSETEEQKERLGGEIEELKQRLGSEIENLKERLGDEQEHAAAVSDNLSVERKANVSLRGQLDEVTNKIKGLESFSAELREEDREELIEKLDGMWKSASKLMESSFKEDLPQESFEKSAIWKQLKELEIGTRPGHHRVPLPLSNSAAAKQMRIAVMLALLARTIDREIFQPTYILDEESGAREFLLQQAIIDSKKEAYCRSILLSMFPEDQAKICEERVEAVIGGVGAYAQDLLSAAQYETFRAGLKQVVQEASDIWKVVQHATQRYEPDFALVEDYGWEPLTFGERTTVPEEEGSAKITELGKDEELLVVFPRVYLVEDSEPLPITPGIVLKKSQSAEATQELERKNKINPALARISTSRRGTMRRSMSISMNEGYFSSPNSLSNAAGGN